MCILLVSASVSDVLKLLPVEISRRFAKCWEKSCEIPSVYISVRLIMDEIDRIEKNGNSNLLAFV